MSLLTPLKPSPVDRPLLEPTWEIAQLFPAQGHWSEEEYFSLETNQQVEFTHGYLEFLPMPTQSHQIFMLYLYQRLLSFVTQRELGLVLVAGVRVQLGMGRYREPDLVFMLAEHATRRHEDYWEGADLVMEIVSPDNPSRDYERKRREYAQAGIPEYWIVDPQRRSITVLVLTGNQSGNQYVVHGEFQPGTLATSLLLDGFSVAVAEVFTSTKFKSE